MSVQWLENLWWDYLPLSRGRGSDQANSTTQALQRASLHAEISPEGLILSVNDKLLALLGYRLDEIQGRHYSTLLDSTFNDSPAMREFWGAISRGEAKGIEVKHQGKQGKFFWFHSTFAPIANRQGKVTKFSIISVDISSHYQSRDDALRMQSAIENAQTAMMMVNRDFVVTYVNSQTSILLKRHEELFRRMWPGFEANKIIGTCIDCFHKNPSHQRQMLADPKRLPYRTDIKVGDVTLSLTVSAQIDSSGNYVGNTLEWADVTQVRKEAAETYADFQSQLNAISRAQAVIEFNLDGTIISANENFLRVMGYSLEEIKGRHHSMFMGQGSNGGEEYRRFWADLREGKPSIGDYLRFSKSGKEIWIRASYNPILDPQGKAVKVIKYATDITLAKQQEAEIERTKKRDAEQAEIIRQKVVSILEVVNAVAAGDFNVIVPQLGDDSVGQVATALSNAVQSIRSALLEVREVASTVATAASEMSSVSQQISNGAQEQASSLEETASSLEEITSTVKQNTDNAQQARQLANGSRDIAEKGGQVVGDAVEAMSAINQSSRKIADIITTIDEIAFQTNLLALNAAVEAARAGEQGRGFAVVAAEVRNLAQRSASAAKEIKTLIQDSVRKVDNGTDLVNRSGQTLSEIVGSVKRVTDIVTEIAAASKEQLTGIEQVNKAVSQMDRVTQGNATQTEEMSGTAESLLSHAQQLQELVSQFKLDADVVSQEPQGTGNRRSNGRATAKAPVNRTPKARPAPVTFELGRTDSMASNAMEF